jgi:glycosyltransferase involved in cell wall biosynthesis
VTQTVETFRFDPQMLAPSKRMPGISAFMRIKNGADFLEATIRSHAAMYDEIVAVYNNCTDATADILAKLSQELGPKLRVFHYLPAAYPAGSDGHAKTAGDAPNSLVTYSNFALCQTRHSWVVKLDDDHLAIPDAVASITARLRRDDPADAKIMHCFAGLNLMRDARGGWHVPAEAPVSGKGDIGYFRVTEDTYFTHDPRFERFVRGGIERQFAGWFYWHLKYLKAGGGFANYDLEANPTSRYARRRARMQAGALLDLAQTRRALHPTALRRLRAVVDRKERLIVARDDSILQAFPQDTLTQALDASTPDWRHWLDHTS